MKFKKSKTQIISYSKKLLSLWLAFLLLVSLTLIDILGSQIVQAVVNQSQTWTAKGDFEAASPRTYLEITGTNPGDDADLKLLFGGNDFGPRGSSDSAMYSYASAKYSPDLAYDSSNNRFLAVWQDQRNGNADIYGRLINGNGTVYGDSDFLIHTTQSTNQTSPNVAYDSTNSRFLVVWTDRRDGESDVYGRLVNADGTLFGTEDILMHLDISTQSSPSVAFDSTNNRFLVVWGDTRDDPVGDVYGRLVNADGTLYGGNGTEFKININNVQTQSSPAVAFNSNNNRFLVAWNDWRWGSSWDVYSRMVNADGSLYGVSDTMLNSVTSGHQSEPKITFDSVNNRFLTVWMDYRSGLSKIYGRLVNSDATLYGDSDIEISSSATNRQYPNVAFDNINNRFLTVWQQDDGISTPNIYGRLVNNLGVPQDSPVLMQTDESSPQQDPSVSFSPTNETFLTAWEDMRPGYSSIYGRLSGTLPYPTSAELGGTGASDIGLREDAGSGVAAKWSAIKLVGNIPSGTGVKFQIRSSDTYGSGNFVNPENPSQTNTWSSAVPAGTYTEGSPYTMNISSDLTAAQTAEIIVQLTGGNDTPVINSLKLEYQQVSTPTSLTQHKLDGTEIAAEGETDETSAKLRINNVKLSDGCSDSTYVKAQFQYKKGLSGAWSATTDGSQITTNAEGQSSEVTITDLTTGSYYWRARLADDKGRHTSWLSFNSGGIGFTYGEPVPEAPTIGTAIALSTSSIRWNFTDNASNETGFKLHNILESEISSSATQNLSYIDETGLTANTQYTRHVHAYNASGDSTASGNVSSYTKAASPNVSANKNITTWYRTSQTTFTNVAGFGAGGVQYYRYVWDKASTHSFIGSEAQWGSNTLTSTATSGGLWYLHVKSYNGDNVETSTADYGPFRYDNDKPKTYAPRKATVRKGSKVKIYYKVTDPFSTYAIVVKIVIKKGRSTKKTLTFRNRRMNRVLNTIYKALLSKGKYTINIYAKDQAGNNQRNVARNYLIII